MPRSRHTTVLLATALLGAAASVVPAAGASPLPDAHAHAHAHARAATAAPKQVAAAPGGPGDVSYFDLGRKDCVGTAADTASKVWFTVADGVLSDVYEPTIDNTNVQNMQYVVTDGSTFTDLQQRDTTYTVSSSDAGMACTVVSRSTAHHYRIVTTYLADPARDTVVVHTRLITAQPLSIYVRLDAHVNGNGGGGPANGGADSGRVTATGVPVVGDTGTTSQAVNRDYAVPTFMALDSRSLHAASVGYAGTASDGLTQLDAGHALGTVYRTAPDGHVVATANVTPPGSRQAVDLALGFGRTAHAATKTAAASLSAPFARTAASYAAQWRRYDRTLKQPFPHQVHRPQLRRAYYLDANVLKASVDKTFPGAVVASLASPWGQAVSAGAAPGGQPVYFGSYREVFARDLYEAVTGFLSDGDVAEARAATRFLFLRQQQANGQMPRNSLLNGQVAPDTGGDQLDETAYPLLMAWQSGVPINRSFYRRHILPAANFLVSRGPSFGVERWEEQAGYSPSTIAAEIAGLSAAAHIAARRGDAGHARLYQAVADQFQRKVKDWTVTSDGPYSNDPYFLRLAVNGDPNADADVNLGNGSITADQKSIVDGGFQELVRLGELKLSDPAVQNSLGVVDAQLSRHTPTGSGYYRYGTSDPGSEDGYGDCWTPDDTNCPADGQPWPTTDTGSGHLWPVLSGERAETALAAHDTTLANGQLGFMLRSASGEGLVPEQVWEDPDLAADPYGTDPTTASIGFVDGKPAGSAAPLTWAQAQELRLIRDLGAGHVLDRPTITATRYVAHQAPGTLPVSITSPTADQTVSGDTTVTGTSAPHAKIDVLLRNLEAGTDTTAATTAGAGGNWSVTVPAGFGTNVITVTATSGRSTGYAQLTVTGDVSGATTVLDVGDPAGDDNGPGTYQYPTNAAFAPGSFDLTKFQVLTKDGTVYLRTTLANLVPTFGNTIGAQLLDVYVHRPDASTTSTQAAYPSRNYTIDAGSAWAERLEVEGFASPTWVDAGGASLGSPQVVASTTTKTITIAVPESAFGTPASGWKFVVTLHGQDGYSSDRARSFAATPQEYQFGVCAAGDSSPICSVDPGSVPKVMDTVDPGDVSQDAELDPTAGPVQLHGVPVP